MQIYQYINNLYNSLLGGFLSGGFCPRGGGLLSGDLCPGGFCPRPVYVIYEKYKSTFYQMHRSSLRREVNEYNVLGKISVFVSLLLIHDLMFARSVLWHCMCNLKSYIEDRQTKKNMDKWINVQQNLPAVSALIYLIMKIFFKSFSTTRTRQCLHT